MNKADRQSPHQTTTNDSSQGFAIPQLYQDWVRAFGGTESVARQRAEDARKRVQGLRDPFTHLFGKDSQEARKKEKVLYENDAALVVSDLFASGTKVLVIPKVPALFLIDLSDDQRRALEEVAGLVCHAFQTLFQADARAWVNPPSALSVRQLHVHINPKLQGNKAENEARVSLFLKAYGDEGSSDLQDPDAAKEIELKFGLADKDALLAFERFLIIEKAGAKSSPVTQTNTFFDTASGVLNGAFCTLRARKEVSDDKTTFELTLKGKETSSAGGMLTQKAESEWKISEAKYSEILSGQADAFALAKSLASARDAGLLRTFSDLVGGSTVQSIGDFSNVRTRIQAAAYAFELDHTRFPDQSESFEVEVELPAESERAQKEVQDFFEEADVKTHAASSKAKRFFAAIKPPSKADQN